MNSNKQKKQPELPPAAPTPAPGEWIDVGYERAQGDMIGRRRPRAAGPALARLGMMVLSEIGEGMITALTEQHCIITYENGKEDALRWGEVMIDYVEPDPAELTHVIVRKALAIVDGQQRGGSRAEAKK
jgi:hypothetical protein